MWFLVGGFLNFMIFAQTRGTALEKLTIADVSSFCVVDKELYRRLIVNISMNDDLVNELTIKDTSSRTDTVFLKVLYDGYYTKLLLYADELKSRLYILSKDETIPVELKNTEYMSDGQLVSEREYQHILLSLANKYAPGNTGLSVEINGIGYYKNDILKILQALDGKKKNNLLPTSMQTNKSLVRFFAGIGLNNGKVKFDGDNRYVDKTSEGSIAPLFAAGFDILLNPYIGKLFLRTELSYSSAKTKAYTYKEYFASKENYHLKLKQNNLSIYEIINYNLYNGKDVKYFIGAGAGFNFSSYPQNQETFIREATTDTTINVNDNYIAYIKKFWLNGIIRTGVTVKNFDIAVAYTTNGNISNNAGYGVNVSSLRLQVNYIFHR
jgi:hypothetical protein